MSSVDWLGVASVLQELGKMSEPSTLDKMQFEWDIKKADREDKQAAALLKEQIKLNYENKKAERVERNKVLTQTIKDFKANITAAETDIAKMNDNLTGMNYDWSKLNKGNKPKGYYFPYSKDNLKGHKGYMQIIQDVDMFKMDGKMAVVEELSEGLRHTLDVANTANTVENNFTRGKTLYEAGALTVDGPDGSTAISFDQTDDQLIEKWEYSAALKNILEIEKELNPDADLRGLSEGFWSGHKENEHMKGLHDLEQEKHTTVKKQKESVKPEKTIDLKAKEAIDLKQKKEAYEDPIQFTINDVEDGVETPKLIFKLSDTNDLATIDKMMKTYGTYDSIRKLSSDQKSGFLDAVERLRDGGKLHYALDFELLKNELSLANPSMKSLKLAPEDDELNVLGIDDYQFQDLNGEKFITRDLWDAAQNAKINLYKHNDEYLKTVEGQKRHYDDNMDIKKAMFYVMNNWKDYENDKLEFGPKNLFDGYVKVIKAARRSYFKG